MIFLARYQHLAGIFHGELLNNQMLSMDMDLGCSVLAVIQWIFMG
jgi:hypothetical protein